MQPGLERDIARTHQRGRRRGRHIVHLVVGMEGRKVQRHIGPQLLHDPAAHRRDLFVRVVLARYQQRRDLEPHAGFTAQVHQRVEHRLQVRTGELLVEVVREGLQVDVGGVHPGVEIAPRLVVHVAGRHGHRLHPERVAGIGDVHCVFGKDHRVVVSEGHALAAVLDCLQCDGLGRRLVHQPVHVARLADVPVLAELAGQVAAGGAERQHAAARVKVVEWFLLDRVDAETRRTAVGGEDHAVALARAHETRAALALVQLAVARAQVALHAPIVGPVPVTAGVGRFLSHGVTSSCDTAALSARSDSFHLLTV